MLDVHFYGRLRRLADDPRPAGVSRQEMTFQQPVTVRGLVERLGLVPEDVGHVFLNHRLLLTCSPMNLWLDYPDAGERLPQGGSPWETVLRAGDRVAFFGQDMALLVI